MVNRKKRLKDQNVFLVDQTTIKRHENKKTKISQQAIIKNDKKLKNNRKINVMGNITPTMNHYPRNERMRDTNPLSDMSW